MKCEILAPVGGREQLEAAIRAGADAVYLGTQSFNARRNAENFTSEDLPEVVSLCHQAGVRVHVTFNILIGDKELPAAMEEMRKIAAAGVDAVIVQDVGVAALFRKCCPSLALHASTQMAIHNAAGVKAAVAMGFRRVVLARELSLEEIREIHAACPEVELEAFVHGALCVSLSGSCYLSAMLGGRSGNRGLCAGPCRLDFKCRGRDYALSLKDMSYIEHIRELEEAGICSLKIEGRMKGAAYVATAVHATRVARDGGTPDMETLATVFSRSGFTDGYLRGELNAKMFGIRTKEDALSAGAAEKKAAELTRNVFQSVPITAKLSLPAEGVPELTFSDGIFQVAVSGGETFAADHPCEKTMAEKYLSRTGGTPYRLEGLTVENAAGRGISPSVLNRLRREGLEKLGSLRGEISPHPWEEVSLKRGEAFEPHTPTGEKPALWLSALEPETLQFDEEAEKILLPAEIITPELAKKYMGRLIARLPEVAFQKDFSRAELLMEKIREMGIREVMVSNLGMLYAAREKGLLLHGDAMLNIYNSLSLEEYGEMGLQDTLVSFEASANDISSYGGTFPRGIIAYGRLPLMRLRSCPGRGEKGCGACKGSFTLTDRKGVEFPVLCSGKSYSTLYNSLPLYVGDRLPRNIDFALLSFTLEDSREAEKIYRAALGRHPLHTPRTGGLYFRETL